MQHFFLVHQEDFTHRQSRNSTISYTYVVAKLNPVAHFYHPHSSSIFITNCQLSKDTMADNQTLAENKFYFPKIAVSKMPTQENYCLKGCLMSHTVQYHGQQDTKKHKAPGKHTKCHTQMLHTISCCNQTKYSIPMYFFFCLYSRCQFVSMASFKRSTTTHCG